MTSLPPLRLARASVFSAVCVILTSAGHLAADGTLMEPWAVVGGFLGLLAFSVILSDHERSLPTIMGGLVGGQFTLHALFTATERDDHHTVVRVAADGGLSPAMVAAHLLAAVLSAWWLRRGERAAWALARQLARRAVPRLLAAVLDPAP
ncbi:MAG: MFS transporter, partial [Streptosporangiaceae bacterium]